MTLYDTGFGRTLMLSGVFTVVAVSNPSFTDVTASQASASAIINAFGGPSLPIFGIAGVPMLFEAQVIASAPNNTQPVSLGINGVVGLPSAIAAHNFLSVSGAPYASTVAWSFSIQTRFWGTVEGSFSTNSGSYATDFQRNSGELQAGNGFNIVERLIAGTTWTLTVGGYSISGTVSSTDVTNFIIDPTCSYVGYMDWYGTNGATTSMSGSSTMTATFGGISVNLGEPASYGDATGSWYYPGHGTKFYLNYDLTGGVSVSTNIISSLLRGDEIGIGMNIGIPKPYHVRGQIMAMDELHPKAWNVLANALPFPNYANNSGAIPSVPFSGPSIDSAISFREFISAGIATLFSGGGPIETIASRPYSYGIGCWLDAASMTANGEPTFNGSMDKAVPVRCRGYNALSVAVTTSAIWDDLSQLKRWYRGGGSSSPGGYPNVTQPSANQIEFDLTKDSSNNPPSQTWVSAIYPATVSTGYDVQEPDLSFNRYLSFQIMAAAGSSLSITVQITEGTSGHGGTDKIWNVTIPTSGVWQTVVLDLCTPNSGGLTSGAWQQDTIYDLVGVKNEWGVQLLNVLRLNLASGGQQFTIRNLQVQQSAAPRWNWLSEDIAALDSPPSQDPLLPKYPARCLTVDCDGRRAEGQGMYPNPAYPNGPLYLQRVISDLVTELNGKLGVTVSDISPASTWYVGTTPNVIGGNGSIFPGSGVNWIDAPFQSGTIEANGQGIGLICPPYCGDIFNSGYTSAPTNVFVQKTMRGRVCGLTLDPGGSGQITTGVEVDTYEGSTPCGSGTSNSVGRYLTGQPYGIAPEGGATVVSGSYSWSTGFAQRLIRRICPLGTGSSETEPWLHQTDRGETFLATVDASKNVKIRWTPYSAPSGGWSTAVLATSSGDCGYPVVLQDPAPHKTLYLLYERKISGAYSVWSAFSTDEGSSWSGPVQEQAGARSPMIATDKEGNLVRAWFVYDSGTSGPGTIKVQYKPAGANSWGSAVTALDQTGSDIHVADGGFRNIDAARASHGPWCLSVILSGGSTPSFYFCTDEALNQTGGPGGGLTWQLL